MLRLTVLLALLPPPASASEPWGRVAGREFVLRHGADGRAFPELRSERRFEPKPTTLPTPRRLLDEWRPLYPLPERLPVQHQYQSQSQPGYGNVAPQTQPTYQGQTQPGYGNSHPRPQPGPGYGNSNTNIQPQPGYGNSHTSPQNNQYQGQQPSSYGGNPAQAGGYGQAAYVPAPAHVAYVSPTSVCDFDSSCWKRSGNCAVSGSYPYDRRTPISCGDCLQLCREKTGDPEPYRCKAVVYDFHWKSCDLFAVTVGPQTVVGYQGRDLFVPTGTCSGTPPQPTRPPPGITTTTTTTTTTTPAPVRDPDCPGGEESRFIKIPNNELGTLDGQTIQGVTEQQCIVACANNQNPISFTELRCRTFNFIGDGAGICLISGLSSPAIVAAQGAIDLTPTQGSAFYEKFCVPRDQGGRCPGPIIREPNKVLIGFAVEVSRAIDFDECLLLCLNSRALFNFDCVSGMFYFDEPEELDNCILNTESADTEPGLLVEEDIDPVDYFQLTCTRRLAGRSSALKRVRVNQSLGRRFPIAKDLPLPVNASRLEPEAEGGEAQPKDGEWTMWTTCDEGGQSRRYRRCRIMKDIRACPKESRGCLQAPPKPRKSNLRPRSLKRFFAGQTTHRPSESMSAFLARQTTTPVPPKEEGGCYALVHPLTGHKDCRRGLLFSRRRKRPRLCRTPRDC